MHVEELTIVKKVFDLQFKLYHLLTLFKAKEMVAFAAVHMAKRNSKVMLLPDVNRDRGNQEQKDPIYHLAHRHQLPPRKDALGERHKSVSLTSHFFTFSVTCPTLLLHSEIYAMEKPLSSFLHHQRYLSTLYSLVGESYFCYLLANLSNPCTI
ncbi:hypothetical protein GW17_00023082 [Ensete ventricosum]|nr:hypothetical protein GW17_00023082 [Ensete ventricosum]